MLGMANPEYFTQLQNLLEAEEKNKRLGRQRLDIWLY